VGVSGDETSGVIATDVWLARGGRDVLRGASLRVPTNCVTALIAPSGAGKSTLLRCITRLLDADRGTITIGGEDVRGLDPRLLRRRVGLVTQRPVMFDGSIGDNVAYALSQVASAGPEVVAALDAVGLHGDWAARDAAALSGGEQARVAIARAVVRDPEILLLDEPTAALDDEVAQELGATLRGLAGRGIGVGMVTHDRAFAQAFADRCVLLDGTDAVGA
jgi:ABC-type multidrug transport system fused ATPase/permease subunit